MEVNWPLSLCSQLRQCTNHSISFRLHTENQWYWLDLSKDEWIGGRKRCPARSLQRSCVLEKATFLHKAKWNNLCLVLNLTTHDVSEGLWVRGDSRHSVSAALYKWLPDVFVPTFFFLGLLSRKWTGGAGNWLKIGFVWGKQIRIRQN